MTKMWLLIPVLLTPLSFCAAQSALPASQPDQSVPSLIIEVVDIQGAVIATGKILVAADDGSTKIAAITNSEGRATLRDLPPGTYTVAVSAQGFRANEQTVQLSAGATTTKITLAVGIVERTDRIWSPGAMPIDETVFKPEITPLPIRPLPKGKKEKKKK